MKAKIRDIISIGIFLVLLFLSVLAIRPAYLNLLSKISNDVHSLIEKVEDVTSLKLSYKSLSPSVLSAFNIKDVVLKDENDVVVVKLDKVKISYKLLKLLKGDLSEGLNSLVADGVEVNIDSAIPLLKKIFGNGKDDSSGSDSGFDFAGFNAQIPIDVTLKNISLFYTNEKIDASVIIKKVNAEYIKRKLELDLSLSSFVKVTIHGKSKIELSGNLGLEGKLYDALENSNAMISVSNLTSGSLKYNKLNLFVGYADKKISWSTIQNSFPLQLSAVYDTETTDAQVNLSANDFSVESIFASSLRNKAINRFKNLKFSSATDVAFNVANRNLSFSSNSDVSLPDSFLPGGALVALSVSGDEKKISVSELSLQGENYDISSNLDLIFDKLLLSGLIDVSKVVLPNGTVISTEVFFDPLKEGFMAFVPQVFLGEKSLTALQMLVLPNEDSIDFSFEGYDYSHSESSEPAKMMIDGSYLVSSKYVQTSISMNSFYLDSVITTASAFLKNNLQTSLSNVSGSVSDFMFSGDAYFSTDFSSLSFNIPYVLLANTKKDNQFLMLSFDGNEQSVTLSQADLIFGKQAFRASASFDRMSESNYFFSLDLNSESIPYHFAGTFTDGLMRVSGDYDTEFEINFEDLNDFSGYVQSVNFPVSLFGTSIVSSLDADFHYSTENGPELNLLKFEMEEAGDKISFKPHISVSGNATKYGAQFNSITYSDLYSVLDGTADITLNLFEDIFNSCNVSVNLQNPLSDESIHIGANISNPDNAEFSLSSLLKNYYFDSTILVNKVSMNRFTILNSANNELTASVFFTGTIEHPYVSVGVEKANVMISGNALSASASILMEDRDISINDVDVVYRGIKINNVSGFFSLDSFAGELDANLDGILMQESIHVPIFLNVTDAVKEEGKFFPSSFTATIGTEGAYGSLMKKDAAFSISAFYAPSMISVISSENIGLFGFYNKSGSFAFQLDSKDTARLNLTGELNPENMEMKGNISDVFFDMEKLCSYINFHNFVEVYSGVLSGDLTFSGTIDSPIFGGEMVLDNPNITLPTVLNDHVFTDTILLTFSEGEINIHEKRFKIKKNNEVVAGAKIFTDKWKLEHIEAEIRTENDNVIPVKIKNPEIEITGNADGQISLYYVPHDIEITGKIFAEKAEVYLKLSKLVTMAENKVAPNTYVNCNLDVSLGTHVRLNADPLIRCIFVPNGSLKVQYDQRSEQIALEGLLGLKSGDVSYLNRNFYIKEGSIRFAQSDEQLNPRITVRAETRERDSNGDNVTIILNAINQEMLSFTPTFSSIPAKSDNEIRTLLGQIVLADSETVGNFLFAAGDYAIQSVLFRKLENSLRDFLNFDILSVRTNIIQNTLSYTTSTKSKDSFNVGNFLDNSTVYIGKYLGSSFYVDAMVHLQFDERNAIENGKWINNYSLQPEVGFEFVSPFTNVIGNEDVLWNFNFRLNIAPDINAMIQSQQFVPATTLSFSWKFSF